MVDFLAGVFTGAVLMCCGYVLWVFLLMTTIMEV
jgi:hypothetical protein